MVRAGIGVTVFPSIGRGMLPRGLVTVPLSTTARRHLVFSGPESRPWSPLVRVLASAVDGVTLAAAAPAGYTAR